jgi:uncharacterized protein involved in exopolysaccharide biosynthesis
MDLADVFHAVISRVRLAPICLLIAFALAGAYIVLTPKAYTATMSIMIDPRERMPAGVDAPPMPQNPDAALVESEMRLLTSRPVLRKVVEREGLHEERGSFLGELLATLKSLFDSAAGPRGPDAKIEAAVDRLEKNIAAKRGERSYVVDIEVRGRTRDSALRVAAALADEFLAAQSGIGDDLDRKSDRFLDAKVADLRARVDEAERKAQTYRQTHGLVVSDGRVSSEQRLKDANTALVAAQGKRAEIEARQRQNRAASARDPAEGGDAALQSPVIEKLRGEYAALARDEAYARSVLGPRHPTFLTVQEQMRALRAQIRAEHQRVVEAGERELRAARAAEEQATRLVATLEARTNAVGAERVDLNELERAAATLRATYEKTVAARENVRRDAVSAPLAIVIDPPSAPASASSPKTIPALLIALAGGFNLWIVAALVADFRARRAAAAAADDASRPAAQRSAARRAMFPRPERWPQDDADGRREDARRGVAAPDFATPDLWDARFPDARAAHRSPIATVAAVGPVMRRRNAYSRAVEAIYRDVLARAGDGRRTPVVAVVGAGPQAGATTLALSLAHAACNAGERALLIERDEDRSELALLAGEMRARAAPGLRGALYRLRRHEASGGEILCLPGQDRIDVEAALDAAGPVDLVLIDHGAADRPDRLARALGDVDGAVLVRAAADDPREGAPVASALRAAGLLLASVVAGAGQRERGDDGADGDDRDGDRF